MKVLFVSSGNSPDGIGQVIKNQGESLKKNEVDIDYFTIKGNRVYGYLKNIFLLKEYLKNKKFDIIHAQYSLSAYVASLAGARPLAVSLMGSDVQKGILSKGIIKLFNTLFWDALVVKSERMKQKIEIQKSIVIPNGVNIDFFQQIENTVARNKVGFSSRKHILFVSNPKRKEKNYQLAMKAFRLLDDPTVELNVVSGVAHKDIPYYYYAADVLLLTSLWEGSPNVIKEAMACNLPIVSTDVGDVKEVIANTEGCYITTFEPEDVAEKLRKALNFGKRTNGREHTRHLDSNVIAKRIIKLYEKVLWKREKDF